MSSVSQIIPNYFAGGISDQPDELKKPGQLRDCVNGYPDAVNGLVKRPGLQSIGKLVSTCGDTIDNEGSYFHFSRENVTNKNKQDYIGFVSSEGEVNVFRCSDGVNMPVYYTGKTINPNNAESIDINKLTQCSNNSYLKHVKEELKFTTVNNYTFITNPAKAVTMSSVNNKRPYEAFIEVTLLAYNREYLVDIDLVKTDVSSKYRTATEVTISRARGFDGENEADSCPANFRKTVTLDEDDGGSGRDLVVDIETVGVQESYSNNRETRCAYRHTVDLINGGRDWKVGDTATYKNDSIPDETRYEIEITKTRLVTSSADYQVTGVLTPSNGDEVASIKTVLNEMRNQIVFQTPILKKNIEIVGNGLYIKHSEPFTVTTTEKDLMNILSNTDDNLDNPYCIVNNVSRLPIECKDGLVALVANSFSDDDDYWVQFESNYGNVTNNTNSDAKETAASGYWVEIAEPGGKVRLNAGTMPQALVFAKVNGDDSFVVGPVKWNRRSCGNEDFNPSFNNFNITNLLFFRNRLCALSQENVVTTKAGDLFNFFPSSALAVSPSDPIDVSAATDYSSILKDGLVINNALLLFSQLQQFQLTTDSDILSPSTAKILEVSRYNYSADTSPINIGTNVGFVSDRGGRAKVYELSDIYREGSVKLVEKSKIISESFLKNVRSIATSPEDELMLFSNNAKTVWMYKFLDGGDKLLQDAWVKWVFPYKVIYHFVIDSMYYAVLQDDEDKVYLTRLDLDRSPTKGPFIDLWESDDEEAGVPYEMKVVFPTVNVVKSEMGAYRSDTTSSLIVHRLNYNFGDVGTYNFEIQRDGYDDYDVLYESRYMDEYEADAEPLVPEVERTIPVYTRNTALDVSLRSDYNQPLILHSMRWEGDYNQRYYKRV